MKYKKTYGINGLLEWHGIIVSQGVRMKVDFTNGSVTAYGVAPATFTTSNEMTQHIIENSDKFKSGRIRIVRSVPLPGADEEIVATQVQEKKAEAPTKSADTTDTQTKVVEVADKMEAVEYLKEHFSERNYTAIKLRSKTAFENACRECGVEFVFTA